MNEFVSQKRYVYIRVVVRLFLFVLREYRYFHVLWVYADLLRLEDQRPQLLDLGSSRVDQHW